MFTPGLLLLAIAKRKITDTVLLPTTLRPPGTRNIGVRAPPSRGRGPFRSVHDVRVTRGATRHPAGRFYVSSAQAAGRSGACWGMYRPCLWATNSALWLPMNEWPTGLLRGSFALFVPARQGFIPCCSHLPRHEGEEHRA